MSKPIVITDDIRNRTVQEFMDMLNEMRFVDGSLAYNKKFDNEDDEKVFVYFTPASYTKAFALVDKFTTEVGWHFTVTRIAGVEKSFLIEDVLVYPQEVTAATVTTDQEKYQTWMMNIDDDTFNKMHGHGHSHVNMSVSPSMTDLNHRNDIISQLTDDQFYLFIIANKRRELSCALYDMSVNKLYSGKEVVVDILFDGYTANEFLNKSNDMIEKNTPSVVTTTNTTNTTSVIPKSSVKQASTPSKKSKKESRGFLNRFNYEEGFTDELFDDYPYIYDKRFNKYL